jgi:hypothetical protein
VDKLVLATINAPYRRAIEAAVLHECIVRARFEGWSAHVASFFTEVAPDLVFGFADKHGISRSALAEAYLAMRARTGERNPALEAELVPMASAPQ